MADIIKPDGLPDTLPKQIKDAGVEVGEVKTDEEQAKRNLQAAMVSSLNTLTKIAATQPGILGTALVLLGTTGAEEWEAFQFAEANHTDQNLLLVESALKLIPLGAAIISTERYNKKTSELRKRLEVSTILMDRAQTEFEDNESINVMCDNLKALGIADAIIEDFRKGNLTPLAKSFKLYPYDRKLLGRLTRKAFGEEEAIKLNSENQGGQLTPEERLALINVYTEQVVANIERLVKASNPTLFRTSVVGAAIMRLGLQVYENHQQLGLSILGIGGSVAAAELFRGARINSNKGKVRHAVEKLAYLMSQQDETESTQEERLIQALVTLGADEKAAREALMESNPKALGLDANGDTMPKHTNG